MLDRPHTPLTIACLTAALLLAPVTVALADEASVAADEVAAQQRWRAMLAAVHALGDGPLTDAELRTALAPFADDPAVGSLVEPHTSPMAELLVDRGARTPVTNTATYTVFDASPMPTTQRAERTEAAAPASTTRYRAFGVDLPEPEATPRATDRDDLPRRETRYEPFDAVVSSVPASPSVPTPRTTRERSTERYVPFDDFARYDAPRAEVAAASETSCLSAWNALAGHELARGCRGRLDGAEDTVDVELEMLLHPSRRTLHDVELSVAHGAHRFTLPTATPVVVARVQYGDLAPAFEITAVTETLDPDAPVSQMERVLVVASGPDALQHRRRMLALVDQACVTGVDCAAHVVELAATADAPAATLGFVHLRPSGRRAVLTPDPWRFLLSRGQR